MSAAGGTKDGDGPHVAQPRRAQLHQRITTTRIAQVDAGDGEVQRDLLVGFEIQVGQVERVTVDQVPVLLVARQALGEHRDALVAQQALVPLEGLAAGGVLIGVAGDLVRDGVERQRLARVEQHQDQVGDALQPIELRGGLHGAEPTASAGRERRRPALRLAPAPGLAPGPAGRPARRYLWAVGQPAPRWPRRRARRLLFLAGVAWCWPAR